nr:PREDICTED: uncharacterized protein LOC109035398 [Bemisia tabaci]
MPVRDVGGNQRRLRRLPWRGGGACGGLPRISRQLPTRVPTCRPCHSRFLNPRVFRRNPPTDPYPSASRDVNPPGVLFCVISVVFSHLTPSGLITETSGSRVGEKSWHRAEGVNDETSEIKAGRGNDYRIEARMKKDTFSFGRSRLTVLP